jgi:hypothetical protein
MCGEVAGPLGHFFLANAHLCGSRTCEKWIVSRYPFENAL